MITRQHVSPPTRWASGRAVRSAAAIVVCSGLVIQGCSSNDDTGESPDPDTGATVGYSVSATNLTSGQPMSPPLLVLHDGQYRVFSVGTAATVGLEQLSEGGDNSFLRVEADATAGVGATVSAEDAIAPGGSAEWSISNTSSDASRSLSMATMLVNTNDAISGINSIDLTDLTIGQSVNVDAIAYDTGTEANSEATGTIPGPADGGEGYNAARDDIADQVTMHSGVVTSSDGLADSVLTDVHRFLNPVLRITVTRTQ